MRLFGKDKRTKMMTSMITEAMKKNHVTATSIAIIDEYKISTVNFHDTLLFQACSFSKTLTAFAILALVEQKKINLDTPINQQLKTWEIPNGDLVTIRHCLSMTSGLMYGEPGSSIPPYQETDPLPNLQNILEGAQPAKNAPIQCHETPGFICKYSGAGFMVLQKIIEEVTRVSFEIFMRENILLPLGMGDSTFECPQQNKEKVVPGFNSQGTMIPGGFENNPYAASGGLWSTATDIAKFVIALGDAYLGKNNYFISKTLATEMLTTQSHSDFGLGIVIDGADETLNVRKTGHNSGYYCQLILFPNMGQGAVVMTNSGAGIHFIHDIIASVAKQHHWKPYCPNFDELHPRSRIRHRSKL